MKINKSITSLWMIMLLFIGTGMVTLAADSSVRYEGGAEKFVFFPGSEYSDSDLFDGFKNVMPGDVLYETIVVENESTESDYVRIHMRAEVCEENADVQNFLGQLSMTVWNESEQVYQESPDELDGLVENVLLGEFEPGEKTELTVELKVPIEMDDTYMNQMGEVDWVFSVEELNNPESVKTGDNTNIGLWVILLLIGIIIMSEKIIKKFCF